MCGFLWCGFWSFAYIWAKITQTHSPCTWSLATTQKKSLRPFEWGFLHRLAVKNRKIWTRKLCCYSYPTTRCYHKPKKIFKSKINEDIISSLNCKKSSHPSLVYFSLVALAIFVNWRKGSDWQIFPKRMMMMSMLSKRKKKQDGKFPVSERTFNLKCAFLLFLTSNQ